MPSSLRVSGLSTLLVLYEKTRQYDRADRLLPVVLSHAESCFGKQPVELATILNNVGTICVKRNRKQQGTDLFKRAYLLDLRTLGPFHPHTCIAQMNYGSTLIMLGQVEEGRLVKTEARAALMGIAH